MVAVSWRETPGQTQCSMPLDEAVAQSDATIPRGCPLHGMETLLRCMLPKRVLFVQLGIQGYKNMSKRGTGIEHTLSK